jgi:hypothetical protein
VSPSRGTPPNSRPTCRCGVANASNYPGFLGGALSSQDALAAADAHAAAAAVRRTAVAAAQVPCAAPAMRGLLLHPQTWLEAADDGRDALAAIHHCLEDLQCGSGMAGARDPPAAPQATLAALLQLVSGQAAAAAASRSCSVVLEESGAALPLSRLHGPPMLQAPSHALEACAARGEPGAAGVALPADALQRQHARLQGSAAALCAACGAMQGAWDALADEVLAAADPGERQAGVGPSPACRSPPRGGNVAAGSDAAATDPTPAAANASRAGDCASAVEAGRWGAEDWVLPLSAVAAGVTKSTKWMVGGRAACA